MNKWIFWVLIVSTLAVAVWTAYQDGFTHPVVASALLAALLYVHFRLKSPWWIDSVVIFAILFNLVGWSAELYQQTKIFDSVSHFVTTFAVSLLAGSWLLSRVVPQKRWLSILLIAAIGIAIGALWEIYEWFWEQYWGSENVIPSTRDIIVDLILDSGGALLAGTVLSLREDGTS